ncbi:MAG TPA: prolyl oligopeptidase family serine peptidase [Mucilaginibacter sp.]|jgi:hypothetical protein
MVVLGKSTSGVCWKMPYVGLLLVCLILDAFGQTKPALTWDVIDHTDWRKYDIRDLRLSDDGRYVTYLVNSQTILQSTETNFKRIFPGFSSLEFVPNSDLVIRRIADTVKIFRPNDYLLAKTYSAVGYNDLVKFSDGYLAIKSKTDLILLNTTTFSEKVFSDVTGFKYAESTSALLYTTQSGNISKLFLLDLKDQINKEIMETSGRFQKYTGNRAGNYIAATVSQGDFKHPEIILYNTKSKKTQIIDERSLHLNKGFSINEHSLRFAGNGQILIFSQKLERPDVKKDSNKIALNIWNYKDTFLPKVRIPSVFEDGPEDHQELLNEFRMAFNIATGKAIELEDPNTGLLRRDQHLFKIGPENGYYALAQKPGIWGYNTIPRADVYTCIDLLFGKRKIIPIKSSADIPYLSPDGKYILFYSQTGAFYSFDTSNGKTQWLTDPTQLPVLNRYEQEPLNFCYGIAGWLDHGKSVLVYSQYDIWKLDLNGRHNPVCITRHEGRRSQMMLRLTVSGNPQILTIPDAEPLAPDKLILIGQDINSKQQCIYSFDLEGKISPQKFMAGNHCLNSKFGENEIDQENKPYIVKSKYNNVYAIVISDIRKGQNLYLTNDFKTVTQVTDNNLHADHNWVTSELLHWVGPDKIPNQGILYKPGNFDQLKKYPVIVCYYQKNSTQLNACPVGEESKWSAFMRNMGYFVSNGYLVFVPDVHYKIADLRESVYNSIVPGVKELIKRPYVDSRHIGATGQSWGGYETMWLVTKSKKLFAAAFGENGGSDMFYASYMAPNFPFSGTLRMGVMPWQRPDLYVKNSAVLFVEQVQTPLCLCNNDLDYRCPIPFGIEMFEYLRILNKPVWLLEYKNQGHGVGRYYDKTDPDVADYRIRFQQFFDHYLKGEPAPKWMTQGTPYRSPNVQSTLEPDTNQNH